jgi:hypothetical protein
MNKTLPITSASPGLARATAGPFAAEGLKAVATLRGPSARRNLAQLENLRVSRLDVQDRDNAPIGELRDLGEFAKRAGGSFARMWAARTTHSEEVAQVIIDAATDGRDRLRYMLGDGARGFVRAGGGMSNPDHVASMRSLFPAKVNADCDRAPTS